MRSAIHGRIKNIEKYLKLSYPYLKADRIKTPTLFLSGEKDFNVPAVGSEQMYQALLRWASNRINSFTPGNFTAITKSCLSKRQVRKIL